MILKQCFNLVGLNKSLAASAEIDDRGEAKWTILLISGCKKINISGVENSQSSLTILYYHAVYNLRNLHSCGLIKL